MKIEKKQLQINGIPFFYNEEIISYSDSRPISTENAIALLQLSNKLFRNIGLKSYLAFGTLLGAVRDKGLITGDEDVDIFIDNEQLLIDNIPYLNDNGLRLIRVFKGNLYSFRINEYAYIDVYILRPLHVSIWSLYCYALDGLPTPKKYFKGYEFITFLGEECLCPSNPEKLLEFWYGNDWRIPVKGHNYFYEVPSHYYWSHKIRPFLGKLVGWRFLKKCINFKR